MMSDKPSNKELEAGEELEIKIEGLDFSGVIDHVEYHDLLPGSVPKISVELEWGLSFTTPYVKPEEHPEKKQRPHFYEREVNQGDYDD